MEASKSKEIIVIAGSIGHALATHVTPLSKWTVRGDRPAKTGSAKTMESSARNGHKTCAITGCDKTRHRSKKTNIAASVCTEHYNERQAIQRLNRKDK